MVYDLLCNAGQKVDETASINTDIPFLLKKFGSGVSPTPSKVASGSGLSHKHHEE